MLIDDDPWSAITDHSAPSSSIDRPRASKSQKHQHQSASAASPIPVINQSTKRITSHKSTFKTPKDRVLEFPGHTLEVDSDKVRIRCIACKIPLDNKRDNLIKHIDSKTHTIKMANSSTTGRRKTVEHDAICFRIKVVTRFLRAGVALAKVDELRDLLEENSPYKLTDSEHLRPLLKEILVLEIKTIKDDIEGTRLLIEFISCSTFSLSYCYLRYYSYYFRYLSVILGYYFYCYLRILFFIL
jgi:hypothetical protein